jgi:hypothetical protein
MTIAISRMSIPVLILSVAEIGPAAAPAPPMGF